MSYGILSLLPPLVAVVLAIKSRNVIFSLFCGGFTGALILCMGNYHCSPISDTTILSSTGAECDLVEHVKTQLPYACVNGVIAFASFILAGFTRSPLCVVFAAAVLVICMFVWNKAEKEI